MAYDGSEFIVHGDFLATLKQCGGYYDAGDDPDASLVAYTGMPRIARDGSDVRVGSVYYNFARAEIYPGILELFARRIAELLASRVDGIDVVCGVPNGGSALAREVGRILQCRTVCAEKIPGDMDLRTNKRRSEFSLERYKGMLTNPPWPYLNDAGEPAHAVIVEDVCNSFASTGKMAELIEKSGGQVCAVACAFNRSYVQDYITPRGVFVPVVSCVHCPSPQYSAEDPEVVARVFAKKVVWDPKNEWNKLTDAVK